MADKEKTRVTNFIKKQTEIDMDNIREVAAHYKQLDEISKLAKKEMDLLKKKLIEAEVSEYFLEDEMKVVFEEGKKRTALSSFRVAETIGFEEYLKISTVSEKAIKDWAHNIEEDYAPIIAEAKYTLEEKSASTIKVGKITKKEFQEMV